MSCSNTTIVVGAGGYPSIAAAYASGATYIKLSPGIYNESITVSSVVLEGEPGVYVNGLTLNTGEIVGGTYTNLTLYGSVVIKDAVIAAINNGTVEITNSKITAFSNGGCAGIYNSYLFAPIISTGGTLNAAENIICPSASSVASLSATNARILDNTIINNNTNFVAYTLNNGATLRSSNNTFNVATLTPYIGSSTDTSSLIAVDDVWNSPSGAPLPARYTVPGVGGAYETYYNSNGTIALAGFYPGITNTTGPYVTNDNDFFINSDYNVTLDTPAREGQVIFVHNTGIAAITVTGTAVPNNIIPGAITGYIFTDGTWQIITTTSVVPVPPAPFFVNNTVFVDSTYGNDATAVLNDPARPALTLQGAFALVANTSTVIDVRTGTYTPPAGTTFATNTFNFAPNALVTWAGVAPLFTSGASVTGYGEFTTTGPLFNITGSSFEADLVNALGGTATVGTANLSNVKIRLLSGGFSPALVGISSTIDIDTVILPVTDFRIADLTDSTINIDTIRSAGVFAGPAVLYLFDAVGGSNEINVGIMVDTGARNIILSNAGPTNIDIGVVEGSDTLISGNGVTGHIGTAINTGGALFDTLSSSNLTIDLISASAVTVPSSISDSTVNIGTLELTGAIAVGWTLATGTVLNIDTLNMSGVGTATTGLFALSSDAQLNIKDLSVTNSNLVNTTAAADVTINVENIDATGQTVPLFYLNGLYNLFVSSFNYLGTVPAITVPGNTLSSTIDIDVFNGSSLLNATVNAGSNLTLNVGNLVSNTPVGYMITHVGTAGAYTVINIDSSNLNGGGGLLNSNGYYQLTWNGTALAQTASLINLTNVGPAYINIPNASITTNTNAINITAGANTQDHLIQVGTLRLLGGSPGVLLANASTAPVYMSINDIVTSIPISSVVVGNTLNLTILNIRVTTGSLIDVVYGNNTNVRLNIDNAVISTGGVGVGAIGITGTSHVVGWNAGVLVNIGTGLLTTGSFVVSTIEPRLFIDARNISALAGTILTLTGIGLYTRVSGQLEANGSVIVINSGVIGATATVQGIEVAQATLVSTTGAPVIAINATIGAGITWTYNIRSIGSGANVAPVINVTGTGSGVITQLSPIVIGTLVQ